MIMLAVCVALAVTGQGWERPVIQEAELAAPVEIEQAEPSAPPRELQNAPGSGAEVRTLPGESSVVAPPAETTAEELRWEYDEEGQPVVRPSVQTPETASAGQVSQPQRLDSSPAQESSEIKKRPQRSRHIATFWFVMPKS